MGFSGEDFFGEDVVADGVVGCVGEASDLREGEVVVVLEDEVEALAVVDWVAGVPEVVLAGTDEDDVEVAGSGRFILPPFGNQIVGHNLCVFCLTFDGAKVVFFFGLVNGEWCFFFGGGWRFVTFY